jgi:hypothetical protein
MRDLYMTILSAAVAGGFVVAFSDMGMTPGFALFYSILLTAGIMWVILYGDKYMESRKERK